MKTIPVFFRMYHIIYNVISLHRNDLIYVESKGDITLLCFHINLQKNILTAHKISIHRFGIINFGLSLYVFESGIASLDTLQHFTKSQQFPHLERALFVD
jgi:hypothetical protein